VKDTLQYKLHNDEQLLRNQLIHKQKIYQLQHKHRKVLQLHVLEKKLFEEVRHIFFSSCKIFFFAFIFIEINEKYGYNHSTAWSSQETSRTNQRTRTKTISQSTQVGYEILK